MHWATAAAVLGAYFLSDGGEDIRTDPPYLHFIFGMTVLALVLPRLLARALGGAPKTPVGGTKWINAAARLGHATLYLLLIAVPITGWYAVGRLGISLSILGAPLPMLTQSVKGDPGFVADLHQYGGNAILIIAGLHATMAFWHQFVIKDNTLARMKPF
jgi:cytochrome b561